MIKNKYTSNYMAKRNYTFLFIFFLFLGNTLITHAQSAFPIRKVGQRHDKYLNNQWIGIDSANFTYNGFPTLTKSENIKGDGLGGWQNNYRFIYLLDANERIIQLIRENWNGGSWVNFNKYNYTFDANGNQTEVLYQSWNGSSWVLAGKIESTGFDAFGLPTAETSFAYSGGTWVFTSKIEYQNTQGKVQISEKYFWNSTLIAWKKVERNFYTYFGNEVGSATTSYPNDSDVWKINKRVTYTYNTTTLKLSMIENEKYDTLTNVWKNNTRALYSYTPSLMTSEINFETFNGSWLPTDKEIFNYNASNLLTEHIKQLYNGSWVNGTKMEYIYTGALNTEQILYLGNGGGWDANQKTTLNYNADDSLTYKLVEDFNGSATIPNARYYYYYNLWPLSLSATQKILLETQLYPNPIKNAANISIPKEVNGHFRIELYDILGRKVLLLEQYCNGVQNTITFSTSELKQGMYHAKIIHKESKAQTTLSLIKN